MSASAAVRLPAEWEPQAAIMLTWPHAHSDWSHRLDAVYPVFAGIGAQISRYEPLLSVCQSRPHAESIRNMLHRAGAEPGRLLFAIAASNDTWKFDGVTWTQPG